MKLVDEARKKAFDEKIQESKMELKKKGENGKSDPYSMLVPGPYTMEFCIEYLEKLLRVQKEIQNTGPDPNITLILEAEIHEIQRIWRAERGDWKNSAYAAYEKIIGEKLVLPQEDLSEFGMIEQEVLEEICAKNDVPQLLVSKLLNVAHEYQGMTKHSKIYPKINKILGEEWRENLDEIVGDLEQQKNLKKEFGG